MSAIAALLAPFWKWIVGALAGASTLAAIYIKGRSDAKAQAKIEDIANANTIRKAGADARSGVNVAADRLRDNDGFKRD